GGPLLCIFRRERCDCANSRLDAGINCEASFGEADRSHPCARAICYESAIAIVCSRGLRRARKRPQGRAARRDRCATEAVRVLPGPVVDLQGSRGVRQAEARHFDPTAVSSESTVVAEYGPEP